MVKVKMEATDLESLLLNGSDEMVLATVDYMGKGKGQVLIKPLTMKELSKIRLNVQKDGIINLGDICKEILAIALYNAETKQPFKEEALAKMPMGVVLTLFNKVKELSGFSDEIGDELQVF